jgi:hypothetical protein
VNHCCVMAWCARTPHIDLIRVHGQIWPKATTWSTTTCCTLGAWNGRRTVLLTIPVHRRYDAGDWQISSGNMNIVRMGARRRGKMRMRRERVNSGMDMVCLVVGAYQAHWYDVVSNFHMPPSGSPCAAITHRSSFASEIITPNPLPPMNG